MRYIAPYSLLPTPYSLLPTPCSLLPTPYSLLPTPYSLKSKCSNLTKCDRVSKVKLDSNKLTKTLD
ncbi:MULTISPECIES: hypothetical protein [Moorena]|uniref:hypothetical protein n=1 Tax=Moorena TaxID=1155738 RepID=UPI00142A3A53|nr:hypothetical protein [Moorena sp. SIO4G3]NEO77256.1 hypothetical protein [Moorena sp. SIO4G3]